ncbi:hypothetical protein JDV02_008307 [Purpureocillium takamizusanense]|uniref:Uncharacterized protein n=1 Tax=Purpureocillium takamizusanense TaxID=2060973 RepID=A0A9Q8VEK7_9HYPO|nr:uncharacterized protein JDV02_008307 [Purpureocillium takamizusanense]UNI22416.1 hypothetical protein JDV02_008307 [Purpureocillium takamizusanense]
MSYGRGESNTGPVEDGSGQMLLPDNADSRPANPVGHRGAGQWSSRGRGRGGRGGYTGHANAFAHLDVGVSRPSAPAASVVNSVLNPESSIWEPPEAMITQGPSTAAVEQSPRSSEGVADRPAQQRTTPAGAFASSPQGGQINAAQESFSSISSQISHNVSILTQSDGENPGATHPFPYNSPFQTYAQRPQAHLSSYSEFVGEARNAHVANNTKARANTISTVGGGGGSRSFDQMTFDLLNETLQRTDRQTAGAD